MPYEMATQHPVSIILYFILAHSLVLVICVYLHHSSFISNNFILYYTSYDTYSGIYRFCIPSNVATNCNELSARKRRVYERGNTTTI